MHVKKNAKYQRRKHEAELFVRWFNEVVQRKNTEMGSLMTKNNLPYEDALHGIQAGIKMRAALDPKDQSTTPTTLRSDITTATTDLAALVTLLVRKGLITPEEYRGATRIEMNDELDHYEDLVSEVLKNKITLR